MHGNSAGSQRWHLALAHLKRELVSEAMKITCRTVTYLIRVTAHAAKLHAVALILE